MTETAVFSDSRVTDSEILLVNGSEALCWRSPDYKIQLPPSEDAIFQESITLCDKGGNVGAGSPACSQGGGLLSGGPGCPRRAPQWAGCVGHSLTGGDICHCRGRGWWWGRHGEGRREKPLVAAPLQEGHQRIWDRSPSIWSLLRSLQLKCHLLQEAFPPPPSRVPLHSLHFPVPMSSEKRAANRT